MIYFGIGYAALAVWAAAPLLTEGH